jgi:hypothetical protein
MTGPLISGANVITAPTGAELVPVLTISPQVAQTSIAAIASAGVTGGQTKQTALNTVGGDILTAAAIVGRIITRGGAQSGNAFTDTTDTAANIVAAVPGAFAGLSFNIRIINNTNAQQTIAAGTGVTLTGVTQIAQNCIGTFLVTLTTIASGSQAVAIFGESVVIRGIHNFNASADPATGNDSTQGYGVGSIWFNTTAGALRWWECRDSSVAAAKWVFSGADYSNGGSTPNTELIALGSGTAQFPAQGIIYRQLVAAGIQPAGTNEDDVLATYTLPANSFDVAGREIIVRAFGSVAANANTKRIKIYFNCTSAVVGSVVSGGTLICSSGNSTTSGAGWVIEGRIIKYGNPNSNTQVCFHTAGLVGSYVAPLLVPTNTTAIENAPIIIAIVGNAATLSTDITFKLVEITATN